MRQRSELRSHALWRVHFSLYMRRGHPLSAGPIDFDEFLQARHIDYRTRGMTAGVYDQILASRGFARNLVLTLQSYQQALAIVAASDCVAILPTSLMDTSYYASSLVAVETPIPVPPRTMWVVWRPRDALNPAHAWLRSVTISLFESADLADGGSK